MTFSLSRCPNKKLANRQLPNSSNPSKRQERRCKRSSPPIPCYKAYSELEKLEEEFLQPKRKIPRISVTLPSLSSSEEENDDGDIFHSVFSNRKSPSVSIATVSTTRGHRQSKEGLVDVDGKAEDPGAEPSVRNEVGDLGLPTSICLDLETEEKTTAIPEPRKAKETLRHCQTNGAVESESSASASASPVDEQDVGSMSKGKHQSDLITMGIKHHIDELFFMSDMESTSLKDFLAQLRGALKRTLTCDERKTTKAYLKTLVSERCRSTTSIDHPILKKHDNVLQHASNDASTIENFRPTIDLATSAAEEATTRLLQTRSTEILQRSDSLRRQSKAISANQVVDANERCITGNNEPRINLANQDRSTTASKNYESEFCDTTEDMIRERLLLKRRDRLGRPSNTEPHPKHQYLAPHGDKPAQLMTTATRKRARKGACALCTTCPCNHNTEKNSDLEISNFARSDSAIEKALIRRVQKLEKTCELNESRMEIVRRKLKQHRREMWKKKKQKLPLEVTQNQFLPDVDEIEEAAYMGSTAFPQHVVKKAQKAIFPDTKCMYKHCLLFILLFHNSNLSPSFVEAGVQVTLTQQMGFISKRPKAKQRGNSSTYRLLEMIPEEEAEGSMSENDNSTPPEHEHVQNEYKCYSKEEEYADDVCRKEWKNVEGMRQSTFSLWRATTMPTTQMKCGASFIKRSGVSVHQHASTCCPWDALFQDNGSGSTDDNGIEQLVGLFGDSAMSQIDSGNSDDACNGSPIQLLDLSQTGKSKAIELISSVEKDREKVDVLDKACPCWRENLAFCMKQNKEDIRAALKRVQEKQKLMHDYKRRIIEAWERQEAVLSLFEQGLNSSLGRFSPLYSEMENEEDHFDYGLPDKVGDEKEVTYASDSSLKCRSEGDHESVVDFGSCVLSY